MKLYNTLTKRIDQFKPLKENKVLLYTCGPTVYDYMHIGNLRKFVFDDTLRRALQVSGFKIKHAMNITDVGHLVSDDDEGEDKLEKGAKRENKSVWEVADHFIDAFKKDVNSMNILQPNARQDSNYYLRATEFITQQIEIVDILIKKGFAYQTKQAIYFDVTKLSNYGELTGQKLSEKEVAVRKEVVTDKLKHHPQDFALWFFTVERFANHDMHWTSPWGEGFPGWHLECSAIIHAVLGDPIDIHTGGVDNIGTHHVNEMAQTEAAFNNKLANYWIHSEHLLVEGKKMAKSAGSFYTLSDITKHGFDPLALRLLFLQSHYRTQLSFSWANLSAAQSRLRHYQAVADLQWQPIGNETWLKNNTDFESIKMHINDDLNTPLALAVFSGFISRVEEKLLSAEDIQEFKNKLSILDDLLGLKLAGRPDITTEQKQLIKERESARQAKQWDKSDQIRKSLEGINIEIRDTEHGPIWSRT